MYVYWDSDTDAIGVGLPHPFPPAIAVWIQFGSVCVGVWEFRNRDLLADTGMQWLKACIVV